MAQSCTGTTRKRTSPASALFDERWKVIVVGDAAMHPAELMNPRGNINPRYESETRGIDWLLKIREHFQRVVWLNPNSPKDWDYTQTTKVIKDIFPMLPLSLDGIQDAVTMLVGARPSAAGITRH